MDSAEYRTLRHHTSDLRLAVKDNLIDLSGALFSAHLISEENCEEVENTNHTRESRAASLIRFILSKVQQSPTASYDTFTRVLRDRNQSQYQPVLSLLQGTYEECRDHPNLYRSQASSDSQRSLSRMSSGVSGGHSFDRTSSYRGTSFDSQRSLSRMSSDVSGCHSFDREFSFDVSERESYLDEDTQAMVQVNLNTIKDCFASLLRRLRSAFVGVDVADVRQYLVDTLQCSVPQSQDLQEIFTFLSLKKLWTYQNYGLIENLNKNFLQSCNSSIAQYINEYNAKLSGYYTAKKIIKSEFFQQLESLSESTTQSVTEYGGDHRSKLRMRLRLKRKLSDECLMYIAELWDSLAETFELPSLTAVIDSIVEKCLEVTWLILPRDAKKIVAHAKEHHDFFRKHLITLITIDGRTLYKEKEVKSSTAEAKKAGAHALSPNPCLYFSLFGECRFGARCRFEHTKKCPSPAIVYMQQKDLQRPLSHFIGYKDRNPDTHKGFLVLKSDKRPSDEIKIVAEDRETAEYAQSRLPTATPEKIPRVKQECTSKKLFGRCRNPSCTYKHGGVKPVETPKIAYFLPPMGLSSSLKNITKLSEYTDSNEAFTVVRSDRDPHREVKIIAESDSALEFARRRLTVLTGRKYAKRYVMLCYVHPDAFEDPNLCLRFCKHSSKSEYSIVKAQNVADEASKSHDLDTFLRDLHQCPESVSEWLNNPESIPTQFSKLMRYEPDILDDVYDKLKQALEWVGKETQFKLKGRIGKLNFSKVGRELRDAEGIEVTKMIKYLFESTNYKSFFNTRISEERSSLEKSCLSDTGSTLETYELKLGINNTDRLAVHLEFNGGRPVVTQLKVDDSRILTVDVMCLNHDHDLRLDLSSFKIASPDDYPIFREFLSTVEMVSPSTISVVPVGPNQEWALSIIRQKTTKAYHFDCSEGKKYLVTVSTIRDYKTKEKDLMPSDCLQVDMDTIKEEKEIEIHNPLWDLSVASQFGQSLEESLAVLMKPDNIPSELKSFKLHKYSTDMILSDFKKGNFLKMINRVNSAMDISH